VTQIKLGYIHNYDEINLICKMIFYILDIPTFFLAIIYNYVCVCVFFFLRFESIILQNLNKKNRERNEYY
jgi:hypothetical protein